MAHSAKPGDSQPSRLRLIINRMEDADEDLRRWEVRFTKPLLVTLIVAVAFLTISRLFPGINPPRGHHTICTNRYAKLKIVLDQSGFTNEGLRKEYSLTKEFKAFPFQNPLSKLF